MTNKKINIGQYLYIIQASLESAKCKIGITDNLERRLKEYNNTTGKSKDNLHQYLFTCRVRDMRQMEMAVKEEFIRMREAGNREIYFYTPHWFDEYVQFIKSHKLFIKEIFIKPEVKLQVVKIVKKATPSLKDRGLTRKDIIKKAQNVKNDEFYTRYEDVEKELLLYPKTIWKNKTVFCNCDDAVGDSEKNTSAFALFFLKNFKTLNLKKLICTHYSGKVDLFNAGVGGYIYTNDGIHIKKVSPKDYTGSFDDPLSLKILKEEADIVCTNPPFSRAIDYWKITIESNKKFLIISNITNVLNTGYIPYFKNNQVWAGYNRIDHYLNPKKELTEAAGHWFTNIAVKNRTKSQQLKIISLKKIPHKYQRYDDTKTLIVDHCYIPNDYKKPFAISARPILNGILENGYKIVAEKRYTPYTNKHEDFARVLIQKI